MDPTTPRVHPQQALAVYVEPLVVERRVAVFGDASAGVGERLAELGAQVVYVWDPDVARAHRAADRAPRGVVVRPFLGEDDPDVDGGSFDVAVVSDLTLFDDPEDLLSRVRYLVGEEGTALVAAPGATAAARRGTGVDAEVEGEDDDGDDGEPAYEDGVDGAPRPGLDYYELFDLVAREFRDVTMIGQIPFHGVALAELGEGDGEGESPAVSVDTQLAEPDRTPDAFLALASERGVRLDAYAIIQLPGRPAAAVATALERPRSRALEARMEGLVERLAEAELHAQAVPRLEAALVDRAARVADLERGLLDRERQVDLLAAELAAKEPELARVAEANARELARYEEVLRDRAQVVARLEAEVSRRERMVRELVDALAEAAPVAEGAHTGVNVTTPGAGPAGEPAEAAVLRADRDALAEENTRLRHKLDALALDLARREGEAQASVWAIAELERRLQSLPELVAPARVRSAALPGAAPAAGGAWATEPALPGPEGEEDLRLASALDELDVLRRALAQEHEARLRAESGEELTRARAEIERQAVLLEELGARPDGLATSGGR